MQARPQHAGSVHSARMNSSGSERDRNQLENHPQRAARASAMSKGKLSEYSAKRAFDATPGAGRSSARGERRTSAVRRPAACGDTPAFRISAWNATAS